MPNPIDPGSVRERDSVEHTSSRCTATIRVKRAMGLSDTEGWVREMAKKRPKINARAPRNCLTIGVDARCQVPMSRLCSD
jgi:hypothetical protein